MLGVGEGLYYTVMNIQSSGSTKSVRILMKGRKQGRKCCVVGMKDGDDKAGR